jgi:uncharacterized membrane protein AbrB (regulator of aidB expression)
VITLCLLTAIIAGAAGALADRPAGWLIAGIAFVGALMLAGIDAYEAADRRQHTTEGTNHEHR